MQYKISNIKQTIQASLLVAMLMLPIRMFASYTVTIDSQDRFDSIPQLIKCQLEQGEKNVNILLAGKTFYFQDNHILFKDMQYPKANIRISGEAGTMIISKGIRYSNGGTYRFDFYHQNTFLDEDLNEVSLWGNMRSAMDTIKVVDAKNKICFIPYKGLKQQPTNLCNYTYVLVTMWFSSGIYKVTEITNKGVYFVCNDLNFNTTVKSYNVNQDYGYSKLIKAPSVMPRFKLCNSIESADNIVDGRIKTKAKSLYDCRNSTFLSLEGCSFRSFHIENITFHGNANAKWNSSLINCTNSKIKRGFCVSHNTFKIMKNIVVYMQNTDNLTFEYNKSENCALGVVKALNDCGNTTVAHNTFRKCGTRLTNSPVVHVFGSNYHVYDNILEDFGYTSISSGVHWRDVMERPCSGVIEDNEIYYTPETLRNIKEYTLMDSGAIYITTQNANTIIRNNYIHDYAGMLDYRGIFCDDGANNCHAIGNKIRNTPTSHSIEFSPYGKKNDPRNKSPYFCQGNIAENNDCDGDVSKSW